MQGQGQCRKTMSVADNNLLNPKAATSIGEKQFGIWGAIA